LDDLEKMGINIEGVKILPEAHDVRSFLAYTDLRTPSTDDPVAHFARLGDTFPRSLLGYKDTSGSLDSHTDLGSLSLRQTDLPEVYKFASVAHICYVDFLTHSLMPAALRQAGLTTVTLDPGPGYMNPSFWEDVRSILPGLTAFMPSENDLRELFKGHTEDLWEMAETICSWGCELVVIKQGEKGQLLFNGASKTRYEIPAYPSRMVDLTGAGDVFCGGFLVGYKRTYDPVQAVMHGNVAASISVEGSGAFYTRDVLPGLVQARMDSLEESVRKV
jgi:sugar/nucleoside kinase (ribokinase family)